MKFDWRNNRDFFAGLFFILIGAAAMWISRDYPMGSALRMGPGYFPTVLGGIVVVFGIYVLIKGIVNNEKVVGNWSLRALIVLPIATWIFGVMMENVGFIPALVVLMYTSSIAGKEFKFLEVTIMAVVMVIVCTGVFIYGLGLPYPLFKGH
jgi:putative tricarboxylic transport membrane protein